MGLYSHLCLCGLHVYVGTLDLEEVLGPLKLELRQPWCLMGILGIVVRIFGRTVGALTTETFQLEKCMKFHEQIL